MVWKKVVFLLPFQLPREECWLNAQAPESPDWLPSKFSGQDKKLLGSWIISSDFRAGMIGCEALKVKKLFSFLERKSIWTSKSCAAGSEHGNMETCGWSKDVQVPREPNSHHFPLSSQRDHSRETQPRGSHETSGVQAQIRPLGFLKTQPQLWRLDRERQPWLSCPEKEL